jgi:mannose-6-phosphate isomerase-like protein (cupin superfamily)
MPNAPELIERARAEPSGYHEFLRAPALSAGTYLLRAGSMDRQTPHGEDEIYFVLRGRARFEHGPHDDAVGPGDVLYVPAHAPHRFHHIDEELALLVVFAPAEGSRDGNSPGD